MKFKKISFDKNSLKPRFRPSQYMYLSDTQAMTIFKKQYIDNKEVIFDAGNMAYNFSFVIACRYELYRCPKTFLECEKSVVKP